MWELIIKCLIVGAIFGLVAAVLGLPMWVGIFGAIVLVNVAETITTKSNPLA
jgi:hypothetical protein